MVKIKNKKISEIWEKKWANGEVTERQKQTLFKKGFDNKRNLEQTFKEGHKVPEEWKKNMPIYKLGHKPWSYVDGKTKEREKLRRKDRKLVNGKRKPGAHIVWCSQPENLMYLPSGFVIHHIDGNVNNNSPDNLFLISRNDHAKYHQELHKRMLEEKRW